MRWVKYTAVALVALCLFAGGGLFYWFINADKKALSQVFSETNKTTPLQIMRQIEANAKLLPTHFQSTPRFSASSTLSTKISLTNEEKAQIHSTFSAILKRVEQESFCKGGSYALEPTFEYKNGVETPKGQRLNASLECKITKEQLNAYNRLLSDLDKMLGDSITLSIPSLQPVLLPEEIHNQREELFDKLVEIAQEKARSYSNTLQKTCNIAQIDFTNSPYISPIMQRSTTILASKAMLSSSSNAEQSLVYDNALPIVEEDSQQARATLILQCY